MSAKVQSLRPVAAAEPPQRSPERAELAKAIERVREAEAALARVHAARERAPATWQCSAKVEACQAALAEAKAAEPARLVARLLDEPGSSASSPVAAAETALHDAENDLQQARQVRDLLASRETEANTEIERAGYALKSAHGAALETAPEVLALLAAYGEAQRRLVELANCLRAVGALGVPHANRNWEAWRNYKPEELPAVGPWVSAVAALRVSADAVLPTVDPVRRVERVVIDPRADEAPQPA